MTLKTRRRSKPSPVPPSAPDSARGPCAVASPPETSSPTGTVARHPSRPDDVDRLMIRIPTAG